MFFFPNDVDVSCQKMTDCTYCILIPKKIEVGKSPPKCWCSFCFSLGVSINLCPQRSNFSPSHPIIFPAPWALGCSCPCQCNRPTVNVQIGCPARELSLWCSLYDDFDRPAAAVIPPEVSRDLTISPFRDMSLWRKLAEMSSRLAMSRVTVDQPRGGLVDLWRLMTCRPSDPRFSLSWQLSTTFLKQKKGDSDQSKKSSNSVSRLVISTENMINEYQKIGF